MNYHETKIRVQYFETDCMGVVHHSNYIRYFEMGRTEMMRDLGFPYSAMENTGVKMPIILTECRYLFPATYDELLTIRTTIKEPISARIRFEYEIYNESGKQICTGAVELAFINAETQRPCRPPETLLKVVSSGTF